MKLRVGSMFAGIGGFDLGFERAGFEVAWCIEWDKNAQKVLRHRFPNAVVYGDIREVDPAQLAPVDVVCGGFPCQDLSVAGKRKGLAGERSGLFHDAMRLVRKLNPSILVLENVPGLLSSNRGLDFAAVLREVGEGWPCAEVAWRILDSRYFGVAQRRRRVFIVASAAIGCAEQVLALAESLRWNPAPRNEARKDFTADAERSFDGGRGTTVMQSGQANASICKDESPTLSCIHEAPIVVGAIDCDIPKQRAQNAAQGHYIAFRKSKRAQSATDDESWIDDGVANTLNGFDTGDTRTTHAVVSRMVVRRLTPIECERLQGFPDGWTQVGTDEKPTADSHRYKQLGNAVTVNVAEWIANRTRIVLQRETEHEQATNSEEVR